MSRTLKRVGQIAPNGKWGTLHRGQESPDDGCILFIQRRLRDSAFGEFNDKPIPLDITHGDSQARVHLRGGSADEDGPATAISKARKLEHYALAHDKCPSTSGGTNSKLATFEVESSWCLGIESSVLTDQLAASVVGRKDGRSMARKGVLKGCL